MLRRRFGAHLSSPDGIRYAAVNARALSIEALQIMVGEGYSWSPFKMSDQTINEFRKLAYGLAVYVHLPYSINPCIGKGSPHFNIQKAVFRKYMDVSNAIGATAVVLHPGYKKELSEEASRTNFVRFMDDASATLPPVKVLFETDAGSKNGSKIGSPDFIKFALDRLPRANFGMCVDTEHMWARGVDLWDDSIRAEFLDQYCKMIELVHLNAPDEGVELGSFIDRHSCELASFAKDSSALVVDLVNQFPTVLERRSLVVVEKDIEYVSALVPSLRPGIEWTPELEDAHNVDTTISPQPAHEGDDD